MRFASVVLLAVLLGLGAIALAAALGGERAEAQSNGAALPRIVNGVLTWDYPTTGALLFGGDPDTAMQSCSGTLIGCETFLTAAHCVCDGDGVDCQGASAPDPDDFLVFLQHGGFFSVSSIAVHPDYAFPVADVALVKLASPVDGIGPTPINTTATPPFGTPATITGFGRSGGASYDSGLKRTGAVITESCTGGISNTTSVCWSFTAPVGARGDDSNTCEGDSGGPLFVDLGDGETVAGITSGGSGYDCLSPDYAFDANVYPYRNWIESHGGSDLLNATCGALPQVGGSGVEVHEFSGDVSSSTSEGRHSFEVPAGAAHLRVTMNASEQGSNDFDLYVKAGSPPTTSDYDCRADGRNQWGACAFASPAEGVWHVLVNRYSGSGSYQTTATVFGPSATPSWEKIAIKIQLAFNKPSKDKISLHVKKWALPQGLVPTDVTVDVGGAAFTGTLDARGRYKSADGHDSIKMKQKKGLWKLVVKRKRGDFAAALADEGLADAENPKPGLQVTVPVTIEVGGVAYDQDVSLRYTSKSGKQGAAK